MLLPRNRSAKREDASGRSKPRSRIERGGGGQPKHTEPKRFAHSVSWSLLARRDSRTTPTGERDPCGVVPAKARRAEEIRAQHRFVVARPKRFTHDAN